MSETTQELTMQQVCDLRQRMLRGEQVTVEELAKVVRFLRQDRVSAAMMKKPKAEASNNGAKGKAKVDISKLLEGLV